MVSRARRVIATVIPLLSLFALALDQVVEEGAKRW